jgi:hypothetical protein
MNKYKVQFVQSEKYIIDVLAENEEQARELAEQGWRDEQYQETGDIEIDIDMVFDVTNTEDPFNPINE